MRLPRFTPVSLAAAAVVAAGAYAARLTLRRRHERAVGERLKLGEDGIVPGAESISLPGSGPRAALVLHGFGDTPQAVRYLAEHLNARGWAVRAPLLPGHGRSLRAFAASSAREWLDAARDDFVAMRAQYDSVALVGLSMGGALATILAAEAGDVPALALIAPYLSMPTTVERVALAHPFVSLALPYFAGRGDRSIHDPAEKARSLSYGVTTPRLLYELRRVVRRARAACPRATAPTVVVQSRDDHRIPPEACELAFGLLGAREKRLLWMEGCGHVITVDYGRERVFSAVTDWLAEHVPAGDGSPKSNGARRPALRATPA